MPWWRSGIIIDTSVVSCPPCKVPVEVKTHADGLPPIPGPLGDIDLNGILGLNPEVRNGYQQINVKFTIKGDAPADVLRDLVEQSRARSAVYDVITNGVPVAIDVDVA